MPTICVWGAHGNVEAGGQLQMPFIRYHPPFYYLFGTGLLNGLVWNSTWRLGRTASKLWRSTCVYPLPPHKCMPPRPNLFIFFNCTSRHRLWKADTLPVKLFSQCPAIINFRRMVEIKGQKIISKKFLIRSWAKRAVSLPNAVSTCSGIWPVWFGDAEGCNELQHTPVCVSSSHSPAQIQLESASLAKTTFHYFHVDPDSCGLAWQGESQTEWMQFVASRLQVSFRTL